MAKQAKTDIDLQIRTLHEAGKKPPAIAKAIGMSRQGVRAALVRLGLGNEPPAAPVPAPAGNSAPAEDSSPAEPSEERQASLESLRGARKLAEASKDPIRIIQAALAGAKVAGDIEQSNPKPTPLAKLPKTRELGAKARKRMHDLLTRMQKQAEETRP